MTGETIGTNRAGVKKAIITAAGRGTRHFPATRTVQKELFPLVDRDGITKPVLQIVVEEAASAGVESVCIICSPVSEGPIRTHFAPVTGKTRDMLAGKPEMRARIEQLDRLASMIEYRVQPQPDGYGDAVLCARDYAGDDPFLLLLGDHVYLPCSRGAERCAVKIIDAYNHWRGPVSGVTAAPADQLHLFGTVKGESLGGNPPCYRVRDMIEKPDPETARRRLQTEGLSDDTFLTFFGMHLLPPRLFDHLTDRKARDLREGGEIQLTSSLEALMKESDYYAVKIPGLRLDMGVPEGLLYTQGALAARSPYRTFLADGCRDADG